MHLLLLGRNCLGTKLAEFVLPALQDEHFIQPWLALELTGQMPFQAALNITEVNFLAILSAFCR
jgi:hypothetical protein